MHPALQIGLPGTQELVIIVMIFLFLLIPLVVIAVAVALLLRFVSGDDEQERIEELEREVEDLRSDQEREPVDAETPASGDDHTASDH